jgi:hypothetical protein
VDWWQAFAPAFLVGFFVIPGVDRFAEELGAALTGGSLKS